MLGLRPPYIIILTRWLDDSQTDWLMRALPILGAWSRIRLNGPVDPDPITTSNVSL